MDCCGDTAVSPSLLGGELPLEPLEAELDPEPDDTGIALEDEALPMLLLLPLPLLPLPPDRLLGRTLFQSGGM